MFEVFRLTPEHAAANPGSRWGLYELICGEWVLRAANSTKRTAISYKRYIEKSRKRTDQTV